MNPQETLADTRILLQDLRNSQKENVTSTDLHCPFKGIEESKLSVNRKIVREYLANINEFKSPGPDELHPRVLKEIVEEILEPLSIIFENSWRTGEVPEDWRRANVVPIFKKGKKVDPGNYRPVSLTSIPGKIFEQIIKQHVCKYMDKNEVINQSQHGFVTNKSCQTNLISFYDRITDWVDQGNAVDIVYLDFSKAFDKVSHTILIEKMTKYAMDQATVRWIHNWLSDRTQRVVVNGFTSSWMNVSSGVPQGSVLGPVLFNIFINDLDEGIEGKLIQFADDTKLGGIANTREERERIQKDLNKLEQWAATNRMVFNREKCKVLHLGNKNEKSIYRMGGIELSNSTCEKDLEGLMEPAFTTPKEGRADGDISEESKTVFGKAVVLGKLTLKIEPKGTEERMTNVIVMCEGKVSVTRTEQQKEFSKVMLYKRETVCDNDCLPATAGFLKKMEEQQKTVSVLHNMQSTIQHRHNLVFVGGQESGGTHETVKMVAVRSPKMAAVENSKMADDVAEAGDSSSHHGRSKLKMARKSVWPVQWSGPRGPPIISRARPRWVQRKKKKPHRLLRVNGEQEGTPKKRAARFQAESTLEKHHGHMP
ncbi:uncharacterized protein [Phyllobates terribilis]|uniref:uncharacterized protein n=1 Tax=Phyllobates terribilis TaxID=111132 RepID=UPI003CCAE91B